MSDHHPYGKADSLTKVAVALPPGSSYALETLWAERLDEGMYRIVNIPFHALDLSYADIVSAREQEGQLTVTGVIERGGHSTYRIFLSEELPPEAWQRYWAPLQSLGCSYERATRWLLGIDVPGEVDIHRAYQCLAAGEEYGVWSFEEAHCGHSV